MNLKVAAWALVYLSVFLWSAVDPADRLTWWLEVFPAIAAFLLLVFTRNRFPLTTLAYVLVLGHAVILMVGGHYTYAEVPLGDWVRDLTGGARNDYDKLGHLAQGFVPAIIAREILVRNRVVTDRRWLVFLVMCVVLAISACYELLEWAAALLSNEAAEAFLGTQGYEWDTQSDMFWALCGGLLSLFALSGTHDRQLRALASHR